MKVAKARRTPPRKDSAEGCGNRKPVSPSLMVSAKPPVWWPIGSEPKRCAYIWLSPHGSNREGIRVKSLPAKMRRACASLKPMTTPIGIRPAAVRVDQRLFELRLAAAGDDDLSAGIDDLVGRRQHEIDALLVHQPGDQTEDRPARHRKPELAADIIGVGPLAVPVAGAERLRQLGAEARIPALVDAVQDAGQLRGVGTDAQQAFQSAAEFGRRDLLRIGRADGGQMRGVDDARP